MAVFFWLMKPPDSHEDQWGQCPTGLSTPARWRNSLKHQRQAANWLKASHSHESDVCKASTFFLSLPLMWQSLFTPSKHIASRRPLPSILVTLRIQRFCKASKLPSIGRVNLLLLTRCAPGHTPGHPPWRPVLSSGPRSHSFPSSCSFLPFPCS